MRKKIINFFRRKGKKYITGSVNVDGKDIFYSYTCNDGVWSGKR